MNIDSLWFGLFFIAMWVGISTLLSRIGGWSTLARRYRATEPSAGKRFNFVSGSMGQRVFPVNYRTCLFVTVNDRGFYLSIFFLFGFQSPPLFVPWSELESVEAKRLFFLNYTVIRVRDLWPIIWMRGHTGECIIEAFSNWQSAQETHDIEASSALVPAVPASVDAFGYGYASQSQPEKRCAIRWFARLNG